MNAETVPTHSIVNSAGDAVRVGVGTDLFPLLSSPEFSYTKGFRIVELSKVNTTQDGDTVSAVSIDRQERQRNSLENFGQKHGLNLKGFAWAQPVVARGIRITKDGDERFLASREAHNQRNLVEEDLLSVATAVDAEKREDVTVGTKELSMSEDGRLIYSGGQTILEEPGMNSLLSFVNDVLPRSGSLMRILSAKERANLFNQQIAKVTDNRPFVLRTRQDAGGNRTTYAAVTSGYAACDANYVCRDVAKAVKGMGLRGEVAYNPNSTLLQINGGIHAENVVDFGAGDAFRAGLWFRTGDARNSNFSGGIFVERNLCRNFIVLSYDQVKTLSIRHFGKGFYDRVQKGVEKLVPQVEEMLQIFCNDWGLLRKVEIGQVYKCEENGRSLDALSALRSISMERELDKLTIGQKEREKVLVAAYQQEPGDTLADLVNAVTRAHEFVEIDQRHEWEVAGGQLMNRLTKMALVAN